MKKTLALLLTLLIVFGALPVGAQETKVLRLATNHTEDYPTGLACAFFAEKVKEYTDGRIQIEVYYNAVLGDEKSTIEQCQFGGIDFIRVSISPLAEFADEFNALQFPFLYLNSDHYWKVLDGDIGTGIRSGEGMINNNLMGLAYYDGGARSFYFSKAVVRRPSDMKNLTIRTQESKLMMGMVSAMGGNATPMASSEIYPALQNGTIDGAENNLPYYLSQSHNEVAPNITMDEHTRAADILVASTITMNKLSPEDQEIVKKAALESSQYQRELWAEQDEKAKQQCIELGCNIIELTTEEKTEFMEAVKEMNASEGAKYKNILDAIAELAK